MLKVFLHISALLACLLAAVTMAAAQSNPYDRDPFDPKRGREEDVKIVKEMLSKQQSEHEKKEYEELLKRADAVLEISDELDTVQKSGLPLSNDDKKKLVDLEKIVRKIRGDLGGDDDEGEDQDEVSDLQPRDQKDGLTALRHHTLELVEEVRKTTRYSTSATAIQSSNSVLRILRFLRSIN